MASIKIPGYERQVIQEPSPEAAPVLKTDVPKEAFGTGVAEAGVKSAEAQSKLGLAVQKGTEELNQGFNKIAEEQYKQEEQQVLAAETQTRMSMHDSLLSTEPGENGVPKGLLQRNLEQANGITKEFDNGYPAIRQKALDSMGTEHQKRALAARLDESYSQIRGAVESHEGQQKQEAYKTALGANIRQRISDAALIQDPQKLADAGDEIGYFHEQGLQRMGMDPASAHAMSRGSVSDLVNANLASRLETDPGGAKVMFDHVKGMLDPGDAAKMQATISGKFQEVKGNQLWQDVQGDPNFKLGDGMFDKDKLVNLAQRQPGTVEEKMGYEKSLLQNATIADEGTKQKRNADDRGFDNAALKLAGQGISHDHAHEYLFKNKGYGYDAADRAEKEARLAKLYSGGKEDFVEEASKHWDADQVTAWSEIESKIKANVPATAQVAVPGDPNGPKMLERDLLTRQIKAKVATMPGSQMTMTADLYLKGREETGKKGWFGRKGMDDAWKVELQKTRAQSDELGSLKADPNYAPYVDEAIHALGMQNQKAHPTASDIRRAIDKKLGRPGNFVEK